MTSILDLFQCCVPDTKNATDHHEPISFCCHVPCVKRNVVGVVGGGGVAAAAVVFIFAVVHIGSLIIHSIS